MGPWLPSAGDHYGVGPLLWPPCPPTLIGDDTAVLATSPALKTRLLPGTPQAFPGVGWAEVAHTYPTGRGHQNEENFLPKAETAVTQKKERGIRKLGQTPARAGSFA